MSKFAPARKVSVVAALPPAPIGFVDIGGSEYLLFDEFSARAPVFSKSYRTGSAFATKNPGAPFVFAKHSRVSGVWEITDGKSRKFDKVFLSRAFVEGIAEFSNEVKDRSSEVIDSSVVESAPDIMELDVDQKFKNAEGIAIRIETRGERNINGIFFKVKDISKGFYIPNLLKVVSDDRFNGYIDGIHYKFFMCKTSGITITTVKKELFLTYEGVLRVLFASHSPNVKPFIKWATETLFTVQMGSTAQKTALSAKLLGATPDQVRAVFEQYDQGFSCIYLLDLGPVSKLRRTNAFEFPVETPDASRVYKYGFTKDVARRIGEHQADYGEIPGVAVSMRCFYVVDPRYTVDAERDLRGFYRAFCKELNAEGRRELVVLSDAELTQVRSMYRRIGSDYAGNTQGMQDIINKLTEDIRQLEMRAQMREIEHATELVVAGMKNEIERLGLAASARVAELEVANRDLQISALTIELARTRAQ